MLLPRHVCGACEQMSNPALLPLLLQGGALWVYYRTGPAHGRSSLTCEVQVVPQVWPQAEAHLLLPRRLEPALCQERAAAVLVMRGACCAAGAATQLCQA